MGLSVGVGEHQAGTRRGGKFVEPKTKAGSRPVPLSGWLVAELKAHKEGAAYSDDGDRRFRFIVTGRKARHRHHCPAAHRTLECPVTIDRNTQEL